MKPKTKRLLEAIIGLAFMSVALGTGTSPAQLRGGDDVCDTNTISDFTQRRTAPFGGRALPDSRALTVVFAATSALGDFIGPIGCGTDGCIDNEAMSGQARNHWVRYRPLCTGRLTVTEIGFSPQAASPASACDPANRWIVIHGTNSCSQSNNCTASRSVARRSLTPTACLTITSSDLNVFKVIEMGFSQCGCSGVASYLVRMQCGGTC
jgi:hypothetical protein